MSRAHLILLKSREAMARKETDDVDEVSQSSVLKNTADTVTDQVTTTGWQRESNKTSALQSSYAVSFFSLCSA